jgi:hypothetical protein
VVFAVSVLEDEGAGMEEEEVRDGSRGAAPVKGDAGRAPRRLSLGTVVMAAEAWLGYRVLVSGSGSGLWEATVEAPIVLLWLLTGRP